MHWSIKLKIGLLAVLLLALISVALYIQTGQTNSHADSVTTSIRNGVAPSTNLDYNTCLQLREVIGTTNSSTGETGAGSVAPPNRAQTAAEAQYAAANCDAVIAQFGPTLSSKGGSSIPTPTITSGSAQASSTPIASLPASQTSPSSTTSNNLPAVPSSSVTGARQSCASGYTWNATTNSCEAVAQTQSTKHGSSIATSSSSNSTSGCNTTIERAQPPAGYTYQCVNNSWQLVASSTAGSTAGGTSSATASSDTTQRHCGAIVKEPDGTLKDVCDSSSGSATGSGATTTTSPSGTSGTVGGCPGGVVNADGTCGTVPTKNASASTGSSQSAASSAVANNGIATAAAATGCNKLQQFASWLFSSSGQSSCGSVASSSTGTTGTSGTVAGNTGGGNHPVFQVDCRKNGAINQYPNCAPSICKNLAPNAMTSYICPDGTIIPITGSGGTGSAGGPLAALSPQTSHGQKLANTLSGAFPSLAPIYYGVQSLAHWVSSLW